MTVTLDLVAILQGVIMALFIGAVVGLFRLHPMIEKLNARIDTLEQWNQQRAANDESRFLDIKSRLDRIENKMMRKVFEGKE